MEIYKDTSICDLKDEIWKDITGYEGLYECSNMGRIKSMLQNKPKILKQYSGGSGQLMVTLCADGDRHKVYVSHIIATVFLRAPKSNKKEVVTHLNSRRTDNRAQNLSFEDKSSSVLLHYHNGALRDWGIKHVGAKTRFVSKYKYIGTKKNGDEEEYTSAELEDKFGSGVRSITRVLANTPNFNTAYGMKWRKEFIK